MKINFSVNTELCNWINEIWRRLLPSSSCSLAKALRRRFSEPSCRSWNCLFCMLYNFAVGRKIKEIPTRELWVLSEKLIFLQIELWVSGYCLLFRSLELFARPCSTVVVNGTKERLFIAHYSRCDFLREKLCQLSHPRQRLWRIFQLKMKRLHSLKFTKTTTFFLRQPQLGTDVLLKLKRLTDP